MQAGRHAGLQACVRTSKLITRITTVMIATIVVIATIVLVNIMLIIAIVIIIIVIVIVTVIVIVIVRTVTIVINTCRAAGRMEWAGARARARACTSRYVVCSHAHLCGTVCMDSSQHEWNLCSGMLCNVSISRASSRLVHAWRPSRAQQHSCTRVTHECPEQTDYTNNNKHVHTSHMFNSNTYNNYWDKYQWYYY